MKISTKIIKLIMELNIPLNEILDPVLINLLEVTIDNLKYIPILIINNESINNEYKELIDTLNLEDNEIKIKIVKMFLDNNINDLINKYNKYLFDHKENPKNIDKSINLLNTLNSKLKENNKSLDELFEKITQNNKLINIKEYINISNDINDKINEYIESIHVILCYSKRILETLKIITY